MTHYTSKDLSSLARQQVKDVKSQYSADYRHCVKLDKWELCVADNGVSSLIVHIFTHTGRITRNVAI